MADPFDQDEFLPIAVPVRRRDRNRGPHFRAERAERADRADRFAERADRFGIIEREQIRRNPLPTTASPFLHDLIYEDCSCTANTSVRSGSTPLKGCQRIVERCRNFQDEVSYQHPRTGRTPLHVAAMQNACLHVFEAIMEVNDGTSVVFLDETGNTPLHLLFAGFHTRRMDPDEIHAIVELLLDPFSASFALRSNLAGSVPLHYACSAPESMIHPSTVQQLLKAAPSCASRVNSKGQTPLHLHCARRNASTSLAQILLEAYPEANHVLDSTSTDKWSPLHYAASDLNQDLIRFLVDADTTGTVANLACTRTGQTALHILCKKNPTERQLPAIQDILAAAPESVTRRDNVNSYTPLHSLCRGTVVSAAIVRAIVEAEPLVLQIPDENQYLALHHACEGGADPEVIDCLLRGFPAATKHLTRKNDTALSLACSANHSGETVRLLLDVGPDALVQKNDYGFSPLHCVCRAYQPNVEIIRAIVDINPAIVTEETNAGETAIHLASSSTGASVGLIEILTAARNTLGANNDLVMREKDMANNKVGNTPLHYACFRSASRDHIETLAMANPQWITVCNNAGYSPLQILCKQGRIDDRIITLFSRVGGPEVFSIVDLMGNTPLHSAMREETDVESLRALIRAFPDALHMRTAYDDTPLHLACIRNVSADVVREVAVASSQGLESALAQCNGRISPLLTENTAGQTPIGIAMEEFRKVCRTCCVQAGYNAAQQRAFDALASLVKILYYGPVENEVHEDENDAPKQSLVLACVSLHRRGVRLDPLFIRGALHRFPEDARCADEEGNFPLHIEASIPVEKMSLLDGNPTDCCGGDCHHRIGILRILLEIYPEATQSRSLTGDFVLGLMVQNGRQWDSTFALTVRTFPQAFHWVQGLESTLTPQIVEKVYNECGVDTLHALIRTRPDLVSKKF